MKVNVHNNVSGLQSSDIYILLTGDDFVGSGISVNTPQKLSDLPSSSFEVSKLIGGRLYVSYYDAPPRNPIPDSTNYYGYLEFTIGDDSVLWVDISSVDTFGVPIQFKVGDNNVGYQSSHNQIIKNIQAIPGINSGNITIDCGHGHLKIVGANVFYDAQPPFTPYLQTLAGNQLKVISLDDSPLTYHFEGSFGAQGGVSLKSTTDSNTFEITADQLKSKYIYLCNGNCVWNGTTRNAMSPNDACAAIYRDIMIGLNEGYFSSKGENNTQKFPHMKPFNGNYGNQYARMIHEGSQSYGYPFADSNLKTLIRQSVGDSTPFDLYILGDDETSA